jgi:hypothetical protein
MNSYVPKSPTNLERPRTEVKGKKGNFKHILSTWVQACVLLETLILVLSLSPRFLPSLVYKCKRSLTISNERTCDLPQLKEQYEDSSSRSEGLNMSSIGGTHQVSTTVTDNGHLGQKEGKTGISWLDKSPQTGSFPKKKPHTSF